MAILKTIWPGKNWFGQKGKFGQILAEFEKLAEFHDFYSYLLGNFEKLSKILANKKILRCAHSFGTIIQPKSIPKKISGHPL